MNRSDTLKKVYIALQKTREELQQLKSAHREPIAIVGMGCRFPGGADTPGRFYELLMQGCDAIRDVPESRWPKDSYYDPDPNATGRMYTARGGFLHGDIAAFDAAFFNISPKEAKSLDPQQRLLLEVSWQALENAGCLPAELKGSKTGVFVGLSGDDYAQFHRHSGDPGRIDAYAITGTTPSTAAGRIAYTFGLQGPCMALDTACSSSLVAVHLACASLRSGESDMALAAGVNLMLTPESHICFSKLHAISPDGACKTFDAAANGYVRGEGCGVVVLKRLRDALAAGGRILALVKGTAINQDGKTNGLTAPNGKAQKAVIQAALANAGIAGEAVDYLEAHGTGTPLGDPIEVEAIDEVLGKNRLAPLRLGSVKTNIGHLEPAAGMAGLIKIILAMKGEAIPPHLHFSKPNPHIPWEDLNLEVTRKASPWPRSERPRYAGLSSFGFSGTNAHLILAEPPWIEREPQDSSEASLLTLSARTPEALAQLCGQLAADFQQREEREFAALCNALNRERSGWEYRLGLVAAGMKGMASQLSDRAEQAGRLTKKPAEPPGVAFLFTGQGSQYVHMGQQLYGREPVFRESLDRCAEILAPHLQRPLLDVTFGEPDAAGLLDDTAFTQPALFSLAFALAEYWQALGVTPKWVLGHSIGEYVAACIAGVFSLEDGLRLIAARGRLMSALEKRGGMLAVFAGLETVLPIVAPFEDSVYLAADNGPRNLVFSGETAALEMIAGRLRGHGIDARKLNVSHAFHSPLMTPMLAAFEAEAEKVTYHAPKLPLVSNVTGTLAGSEVACAGYWVDHVSRPVQFAAGINGLIAEGAELFLEIGPKPVLSAMARRWIDGKTWLPSLSAKGKDTRTMLETVAALYQCGYEVDLSPWMKKDPCKPFFLPGYPFQRQRYWLTPARQKPTPVIDAGNRLLGARLHLAAEGLPIVFANEIHRETRPYLEDHQVCGQVIFPASAFLDMAATASRIMLGAETLLVEGIALEKALILPAKAGLKTQLVWDSQTRSFAIHSHLASEAGDEPRWSRHVTGRASVLAEMPDQVDLDRLEARLKPSASEVYEHFGAIGLEYGTSFQTLEALGQTENEILAKLRFSKALQLEDHALNPIILDAGLQAVACLFTAQSHQAHVPTAIGRLYLYRTPDRDTLWAHARLVRRGEGYLADMRLLDANGQVMVEMEGIEGRQVHPGAFGGEMRGQASWLYKTDWQPVALEPIGEETLPSAKALVESCQPELAAWLVAPSSLAYQASIADLETRCVSYILEALAANGELIRLGSSFTLAEARSSLRVAPSMVRLFERLLEILTENGVLKSKGAGWQVMALPEPYSPPGHAPAGIEADLLERCGRNLADVLRGEVAPLELLFPGGDASAVGKLYAESCTAAMMNTSLALMIRGMLRSWPHHRKMRILEIGAGTGGTTATILSQLPSGRVSYVFSDISPTLVEQAKTRFSAYSFVEFEVLDIEKSPAATGRFDLVIAANVLHATRHLDVTLGNVRQCLGPGGMLALLEGVAPLYWLDLTFGMTEGWWCAEDGRKHPLIPSREWETRLKANGFQSAASTQVDVDHGALGQQAIILASADTGICGNWLLLDDGAGMGEALSKAMVANGAGCIQVSVSAETRDCGDGKWVVDPSDAEGIRRLVTGGGMTVTGVVDLRGLEPGEDLTTPFVDCALLLHLVQALGPGTAKFVLVTRGACQTGLERCLPGLAHVPLLGMGKVMALEFPGQNCKRIDLEPLPGEGGAVHQSRQLEASAARIFLEICHEDGEAVVTYRQGQRLVPRLMSHQPLGSDASFRLASLAKGGLEKLVLQPAERRVPGFGEVEIKVRATGLNFIDVLDALGVLPFDRQGFGMECAGEVAALGEGVTGLELGSRVVALADHSFASFVTTRRQSVAPIPEHLSFEDAATLPIAFLTAWYALYEVAGLKAGARVLIHAAAGGTGFAAVLLAQRIGAEVFATASPGKWAFLRDRGVAHVMNSRETGFAEEILHKTAGEGVDVVLNCLAGDFIPKSISLVRPGGRFLEIGKTGVWQASEVAALNPDIDYHLIDMFRMFRDAPERIAEMFQQLMAAFAEKSLKPLPYRRFSAGEIKEAFRYMQQARHIGKILVVQPDRQRTGFRSGGSYLITGGTGGLGLKLAERMARRGAGHIILLSRRDVDSATREAIAAISELGAEIHLVRADVTDRDALQTVLAKIQRSWPPLRGVFHLAGVLADAALRDMTWQQFERVLAPKVKGAWYLHELTCQMDLDMFVLFSSAAALIGNQGQANHAAANAYLDGLAYYRREMGLPALSINWGAWSEDGIVATPKIRSQLKSLGLGGVDTAGGLDVLERCLAEGLTQIGVIPVDWPVFLKARVPSSFFANFQRMRDATPRTPGTVHGKVRDLPTPEKPETLLTYVCNQAARELGLEQLDPETSFHELGLDSLMAVELKNRLAQDLGVDIPSARFLDDLNASGLAAMVAEIWGNHVDVKPEPVAGVPPVEAQEALEALAQVDQLSDAEVEAMLAAMNQGVSP